MMVTKLLNRQKAGHASAWMAKKSENSSESDSNGTNANAIFDDYGHWPDGKFKYVEGGALFLEFIIEVPRGFHVQIFQLFIRGVLQNVCHVS